MTTRLDNNRKVYVLSRFRDVGADGLTDEELCDAVWMAKSYATGIRRALVAEGCLLLSGLARLNSAGHPVGVYVINDNGRALLGP